jgi:hypothetical protein
MSGIVRAADVPVPSCADGTWSPGLSQDHARPGARPAMGACPRALRSESPCIQPWYSPDRSGRSAVAASVRDLALALSIGPKRP